MPYEIEELNAIEICAPPVKDELEHFYVCETCGQAVDSRQLGDMLYHEIEGEGHAPLTRQ